MIPRARIADLELVEQHGELLIRDHRTEAEHSLHPLAAYVWKHSDGRTGVPALAAGASASLNTPVTEDEVWAAVDVLTGAALLEERIAPPAATVRVGRRDLLRSLGTGSVAAAAVAAVSVGAAGDASGQPSAENAQKLSAEGAEKRFDRLEDRIAQRAAESEAKFVNRVAQEEAQKNAAESRAKSRDDFENVILEAYWDQVGDPFAPAQFVSRNGVVSLMGSISLLSEPPSPEIVPCVNEDPTADPPDPDVPDQLAARVTVLPEHCRPARTMVFRAPSSGPLGTHEIHVTPAGGVFVIAPVLEDAVIEEVAEKKAIKKEKKTKGDGTPMYDWPARLSLSGITFPVSRATDAIDNLDAREERAKARQAQEQDQKSAEQNRKSSELNEKRSEEARRKQQQAQEQKQKQAQEQQQKQQAAEQQKKKSDEAQKKQSAEQKGKSGNTTPPKPAPPKPPSNTSPAKPTS